MPKRVKTSDASAMSRLDHLGIVAGMCDEIGLVEVIDELIPCSSRRIVTHGTAVKAMILNGLGFAHRTLYLSPGFFADKPVGLLLGDDLEASHFNDDCLGKTLDALYAYGVSRLFFRLSYQAHQHYDIAVVSRHLDGTSLSVQGVGNNSEDGAVKVVKGYNKQGQKGLAQVVLQLVSNGKGGLPLFMSVHDGNAVDKQSFPKVIGDYQEVLSAVADQSDLSIWVADNALYTSQNIAKLSKVTWLTRAGHDLRWVKNAYIKSENQTWTAIKEHQGYRYQVFKTDYGGVQQAALVLYSTTKYEKDVVAFEKRLTKAHANYEKSLAKLCKQSFDSEALAQKAAKDFSSKGSSYYSLEEVKIVSTAHYKRGRRSPNAQPVRYSYWLQATKIVEKPTAIAAAKASLGKFVLATNDINKGANKQKLLKRSVGELLTLYKNDQQKVEGGFRFIKDPLFLLSYIFLQLPRRIVAVSMLMCLCLLIYCLAEYKLRKSLAESDSTLPNQLGKEVSNPTMRWIFMQFRGVSIAHKADEDYFVVYGLSALHRKILSHLGTNVGDYYGV